MSHLTTRLSLIVALIFLAASCAQPGGLAERGPVPAGKAPPILPLDELLARANADATPAEPSADLAARAARLRARAGALAQQAASPGT